MSLLEVFQEMSTDISCLLALQAATKLLEQMGEGEIHLSRRGNPVDTRVIECKCFAVAVVGRLYHKKDVELLFESIEIQPLHDRILLRDGDLPGQPLQILDTLANHANGNGGIAQPGLSLFFQCESQFSIARDGHDGGSLFSGLVVFSPKEQIPCTLLLIGEWAGMGQPGKQIKGDDPPVALKPSGI